MSLKRKKDFDPESYNKVFTLKQRTINLLDRNQKYGEILFRDSIYKDYNRDMFDESDREMAERVHYEPLYLASYNEIWYYCKDLKKEIKEKMPDTWKRDCLLLSYSIFILNIVGKLNYEAFANIKLKHLGKLVEKAKNYLTEFDELTWSFHQNVPKGSEGSDPASKVWNEYLEIFNRFYGTDFCGYFRKKEITGSYMFGNIAHRLPFVTFRNTCFYCLGHHEFNRCKNHVYLIGKAVVFLQWSQGSYDDLLVDESLRQMLKGPPLFSVYFQLALQPGRKFSCAIHELITTIPKPLPLADPQISSDNEFSD